MVQNMGSWSVPATRTRKAKPLLSQNVICRVPKSLLKKHRLNLEPEKLAFFCVQILFKKYRKMHKNVPKCVQHKKR